MAKKNSYTQQVASLELSFNELQNEKRQLMKFHNKNTPLTNKPFLKVALSIENIVDEFQILFSKIVKEERKGHKPAKIEAMETAVAQIINQTRPIINDVKRANGL